MNVGASCLHCEQSTGIVSHLQGTVQLSDKQIHQEIPRSRYQQRVQSNTLIVCDRHPIALILCVIDLVPQASVCSKST